MKDELLEQYIRRIDASVHTTMQKLGALQQLKSDLTGPQFHLLRLLQAKGTMASSELAGELSVKPSAVTAMIDRLDKSQLVERTRDENDRRVVFISITDKGRERVTQVEAQRVKVMKHYFSHLEEEELETLVRLYEKLAGVMTSVNLSEDA